MSSNILTEQLRSAVDFECIRIRIKDLQRAHSYLELAAEAIRRYNNHLKAVEDYDQAARRYEPWTFILTKEQAIKRVQDTQAVYKRCMNIYNNILKRSLYQ